MNEIESIKIIREKERINLIKKEEKRNETR